jgi:hypothetical protein
MTVTSKRIQGRPAGRLFCGPGYATSHTVPTGSAIDKATSGSRRAS